jgi:hypothetical protein
LPFPFKKSPSPPDNVSQDDDPQWFDRQDGLTGWAAPLAFRRGGPPGAKEYANPGGLEIERRLRVFARNARKN